MRNNSHAKSGADREPDVFRRSAFKTELSPGHSNEYRASMHWGVACIIARADVYAVMMGSVTDDQIRQPRSYRRGIVQSAYIIYAD